jgi:hypothetical protein
MLVLKFLFLFWQEIKLSSMEILFHSKPALSVAQKTLRDMAQMIRKAEIFIVLFGV